MAKYRKKPVVIEAIQWTGDNINDVVRPFLEEDSNQIIEYSKEKGLYIHTLEGKMFAQVGDYIIQGIHGEFYPCKPDIFEQTYEPVEE